MDMFGNQSRHFALNKKLLLTLALIITSTEPAGIEHFVCLDANMRKSCIFSNVTSGHIESKLLRKSIFFDQLSPRFGTFTARET